MSKRILFALLAILFITSSAFAQETYNLQLKAGDNLVALPLIPQDNNINSILSAVITQVKDVWEFNPSDVNDPWKHYQPGMEGYSDLSQMNNGKGYWINVKTNVTLQITGTPAPGNYLLELKTGWNVIGWPYQDSQAITEALGAINFGMDYSQVSRMNSLTKLQENFLNQMGDSFSSFYPGEAYYIYMLQDKMTNIVGYHDITPPIGTILINDGAESTGKWSVNLTLSAEDSGSGMGPGAQMQFSNDSQNWSTLESYATTKQWNLSSGFGTKTVYVKFKDVAGNTAIVSDAIELINVPTPTERIYIYLNGQRVAMKENGNKYFYLNDHLGGTNVVTNESGAQVKHLEYQPFGDTKTEEGSLDINKKFTGKEFDDSTGLYNYSARMYDPKIGRFISADPILPDLSNPQALNRYSYCLNNPVKYIDPTGHEALEYEIALAPALIAGYLIFKSIQNLSRSIHDMPYTKLNLRLPGTSQVGSQSRSIESLSDGGIKYQSEGMSYADKPNTNVLTANGVPKTGHRYVGEKEAKEIEDTGSVPNVDEYQNPKNVFYTPDRALKSRRSAAERYNLKDKPTHRVDLDISNTKANYGGNVAGGKGTEMTTRENIPAKRVERLED